MMRSLAQSFSSGYKRGQAPIDEYEWKDRIFGKIGIKRVETKRFVRFENLSIRQKENGYWYSRRSHWFINFPFCKNDKQLWIANAISWFLFMQVTVWIMIAMSALVALIQGQ